MINIKNPRAKARAQRFLIRQMSVIERQFAKGIYASLNGSFNEVANLLEQDIQTNMDPLLDQWLPALGITYRTGYKRTGSRFSSLIFDNIAKLKFTRIPETKGMKDIFWNAFDAFTKVSTANNVVKVTNTTKKWIANRIRKGVEEGKSYGEIAKDLKKKKRFNAKRAKRIAITEVHSAANYATQEAVKTTGLEMEKEWVAFIDDRTRVNHILANGQRKSMNQDFKIGGVDMGFPGDPKGGAGNVINCRCVLLYHTIRNSYKII